MAKFGNNQNDDSKKAQTTNTKGIQMYNLESFDPSTLLLDFWDRYHSVKIHPALPEKDRTEKDKYNYDQMLGIVFLPEHAKALYRKALKKVLPALEAESQDDASVGITVKNNLIEIGNGIKHTGKITPYVAIYKDIDPSTGIANQAIAFQFPEVDVVSNYNAKKGTFDSSKDSGVGAFEVFLEFLNEGVKGQTRAVAHGNRDNLKFVIKRVIEDTIEIKEKLGIQGKSGNSYKNYDNSGGSFASRRNNSQPSNKSNESDEAVDFNNDKAATLGSFDDLEELGI